MTDFSSEFSPFAFPEIYLDYAAATPVRKACLTQMLPYFQLDFANPANRLHSPGERAQNALELARSQIAEVFGLASEEVVFTGSATEANNLLIRGLWTHPLRKRSKILMGATEHSCVAATCERLRELSGAQVETLRVGNDGQVLESEILKIDHNTLLVCTMDVNNETGVIQSQLAAISKKCQEVGAHLHIDGVQGFARHDLEKGPSGWNSAVISGAKIYGPKGAAALLLRKQKPRIRLEALVTGGGQESGLRSGTQNLPAIVGLAEACKWTQRNKTHLKAHFLQLEVKFLEELRSQSQVPFRLLGHETQRAPGILSLCFEKVNGMKLAEEAKGICLSVGSACRTLQATASPVLLAMGLDLEEALATVRVSFGAPNTVQESLEAARLLAKAARDVRNLSATL